MRYSQNLFLVTLLFFVVSCKQSNFQTKKYLNLKKLESAEENVKSEASTLNEDQQLGTAKYAAESDVSDLILSKDEVQEPIQTQNFKTKDSEESDQLIIAENAKRSIPESLVKQKHIYRPKPLFLDDDVEPEVKKLENFILLSLIMATIFAISVIAIGALVFFVSSPLIFIMIMGVCALIAMTFGVIAHINAMKYRRLKAGTRRNFWVIFGIVGGWVWFAIAGVNALNILIQYLLF